MKLIQIDGNTQRLDGGAMFGNAPKAMWEQWNAPDEHNRISLACRALLMRTDNGLNVLFEAGVGAFFEPKYKERYGIVEDEHILLQSLEKHGLQESDIDIVILSHLHFDHAGGILSCYNGKDPHLLFPKATFFVGRQHWERAQAPLPRERVSFIPLIQKKLTDSKRLVLIDQETHPDLDFGIHFRFFHGHTVGLMVSVIALDAGPLAFVSDLIPGLAWTHLSITMGYDRFPELVVEEKKAFLNELLAQSGKLYFTHDPSSPCATIKKTEQGKFFGDPINLASLGET